MGSGGWGGGRKGPGARITESEVAPFFGVVGLICGGISMKFSAVIRGSYS